MTNTTPARADEALPELSSLWDFDDPAASEGRFREALAGARERGERTYAVEALSQIGRTHSLRKQLAEAHAVLDEAEALLVAIEADGASGPEAQALSRARVRVLLERGRTHNSAKQQDAAKPLFERAYEVAREAGLEALALDAAHMMGIACAGEEALRWSLSAIEVAEASQDPKVQGWLGPLYNNTGWTCHDMGRFDEALALFEKGVRFRAARGEQKPLRIARWTVARCLRSLARHDEALAMLRAALPDVDKDTPEEGFVEEEIAENLLATGHAVQAREHFARAAKLLASSYVAEEDPPRLARLQRLGAGE